MGLFNGERNYKMANYTFYNKWTTPIFISNHERYHLIKDKLIQECNKEWDENQGKNSGVATTIKGRLYESPIFNTLEKSKNNSALKEVERFVISQMRLCLYDFFSSGHYPDDSHNKKFQDLKQEEVNVDPYESWVHISEGQGSWHGMHHHPNTSWGAIYYVDIADSSTDNGGLNGFKQPFLTTYNEDGNFFQHQGDMFFPPMDNGGLVLFPANLMHNASPYYGDKKRIVIAANIRIRIGV